MDKYMKKSDVIAYIRNEAKEAQSAFEELGGESGIIAEAFNDLANDFSQGAVPYTTAEEAFAQIPSADVAQWISVKDRLPDVAGMYIVTACDEWCSHGEGIWYDTVVVVAEYSGSCWNWNDNGIDCDIDDLVTHWMPLPEPPKGDADNG